MNYPRKTRICRSGILAWRWMVYLVIAPTFCNLISINIASDTTIETVDKKRSWRLEAHANPYAHAFFLSWSEARQLAS
ncbi:hypothetical protein F5X98DRAFT_349845 [Xylaria grammica]|nr:hypothetical protein F5X98DRAFT_349845 [Xylaria grammica]